MVRQLRHHYAGGWYHITARGMGRQEIFETDRDREHFAELLAAIKTKGQRQRDRQFDALAGRERSGETKRVAGGGAVWFNGGVRRAARGHEETERRLNCRMSNYNP